MHKVCPVHYRRYCNNTRGLKVNLQYGLVINFVCVHVCACSSSCIHVYIHACVFHFCPFPELCCEPLSDPLCQGVRVSLHFQALAHTIWVAMVSGLHLGVHDFKLGERGLGR